MEFIRGRLNIDRRHRGCVTTIGNFDGVHLGHRAVISQLHDRSRERGRPSMVVVFEPQPQEYFRGRAAPARLSPLRDKLALVLELGVDYLLCLRFNHALAQTSADDFVRHLLVEELAIEHLVVGDDFRFGHHRKGDFSTLVEAGRDLGFSVEEADTYEMDSTRVSSTRIREELAAGHLEEAEKLLGRHFRIGGRVAHGDKRGREWGFPTANIDMDRRRVPFTGVYAVHVFGLGDKPIKGVANIGVRPAVPGSEKALLEVYLLGFNAQIYGKRIEIGFVEKIREEEWFKSFDALKKQIALDIKQAERIFSVRNRKASTA